MAANLNIDLYRRAYFYFDRPVEYQLKSGKTLNIYPVSVADSEIFLSSMGVIDVDKNASPSVEIIQMSYLAFIYNVLFQDQLNVSRFVSILKYCLHIEKPEVGFDDNGKPYLRGENNIDIKEKDFEEIRRIILYQNIVHYDDEYINPDAKKAMEEMDKIRSVGIESPTIERRMAIITAHCGISKQEQMNMTYRSHSLLFEEVYGEVEFTTVRPVMLYVGKDNEMEHWIYKKKKDKFDDYFTSVSEYGKKFGVGEAISVSESLNKTIDKYLKK